MGLISKIRGVDGATHDLKQQIYTVKGTQTATTATWTGSIDVDALWDGLTIAYYLPRTSASGVTLNLTLKNGTNTGAIAVYYTGTTQMSDQYGAGSTILLTYWSAGSISVNGTATSAARWTSSDYNKDTTYSFADTYNASTNKGATVATVTNAINALDGSISGSPGSGKTLTAFSQTNGVVSATFGNISITKSQVSDFPASMPASDVYTWAKAESKPSYNFSEINNKPTSLSGYGITDAYTKTDVYTKTEIDGKISGVLHYKGTKATVSDVTSLTGMATGDVWHVTANGAEYAYDGSAWQELGTAVDLSGYSTTSHTHTTTLATDTGTSAITLASAGKYKLTAGGTSVIFTMPTIPTVNYPVTSVNSKTGAVTLTAADVGAATSGHTHTTSLATDTGTSSITLASAGKYKLTAGGTSVIFTMPTSNNYVHPSYNEASAAAVKVGRDSTGHVVIGDAITASDVGAATSGHTHTTSLATDAGTSSITLASAGKYKLTAGGTSVIFTMPTIPTVNYPVTSVNSKTGAVTLTASDVGAQAAGDYMVRGTDYVTAGKKSDTTLGSRATAEGYNTTASGDDSHAEGYNTTASGTHSHAEGTNTTASGGSSHAEGLNTIAQRANQHVFGRYNIADTGGSAVTDPGTYIEIVGNGTAVEGRSNARTLDWLGNEVLAGKLTVGVAPTANMDVATKQYVDNSIPSVPSAYTSTPEANGTGSSGSSTSWSRGDHVHPTDTSRQAKITTSGILKGDGSGGISAAVSGTDYAAASHNHAASDITSGTLGVARGGTGQSSLTSGSYLVGSGTSAVTLKTASQVLSDIGAQAAITYSTTDLTAGTSTLATGTFYAVYE